MTLSAGVLAGISVGATLGCGLCSLVLVWAYCWLRRQKDRYGTQLDSLSTELARLKASQQRTLLVAAAEDDAARRAIEEEEVALEEEERALAAAEERAAQAEAATVAALAAATVADAARTAAARASGSSATQKKKWQLGARAAVALSRQVSPPPILPPPPTMLRGAASQCDPPVPPTTRSIPLVTTPLGAPREMQVAGDLVGDAAPRAPATVDPHPRNGQPWVSPVPEIPPVAPCRVEAHNAAASNASGTRTAADGGSIGPFATLAVTQGGGRAPSTAIKSAVVPHEERLNNLRRRFPHLSKATIHEALESQGGHAGMAAKALEALSLEGSHSNSPSNGPSDACSNGSSNCEMTQQGGTAQPPSLLARMAQTPLHSPAAHSLTPVEQSLIDGCAPPGSSLRLLLEEAVRLGETDGASVATMMGHVRSGRFTCEHYTAMWQARLVKAKAKAAHTEARTAGVGAAATGMPFAPLARATTSVTAIPTAACPQMEVSIEAEAEETGSAPTQVRSPAACSGDQHACTRSPQSLATKGVEMLPRKEAAFAFWGVEPSPPSRTATHPNSDASPHQPAPQLDTQSDAAHEMTEEEGAAPAAPTGPSAATTAPPLAVEACAAGLHDSTSGALTLLERRALLDDLLHTE